MCSGFQISLLEWMIQRNKEDMGFLCLEKWVGNGYIITHCSICLTNYPKISLHESLYVSPENAYVSNALLRLIKYYLELDPKD